MSLLWPDSPNAPGKRERQRFNPRPPVPKTGWKLVNEFPSLRSAKAICFDVETKDPEIEEFGPGWARGRGHIIGVAIATDDGFKRYYPMRHEGGPNCDPQHVLGWLNEELSRPHQCKVGHNIIYDLGWLAHEGVNIRGDIHDTWSAEKILRHSADATLEECGQRYLKEGKESSELYDWAWSYWGRGSATPKTSRKLAMSNLYRVPPELVGFYAESDVEVPLRILPEQMEQLERKKLWGVYRLECDMLPLLVQMRLAGVSVNVDAAEQAKVFITKEINQLQVKIDEIAGCPTNTGSPIEMGRVFDRLHITYPLTEKTQQPQLKAEFLKTLEHPIGQLVVEIEELKKMRSSFVENAILQSNVNGKIYCQIKPLTAVTGRMSASDPNTQQIPSRTELGKKVREIFIPDEGHDHLRKSDYSSVESRILGHYAVGTGARELRKEYKQNPLTDYHNFTRDLIKATVGLELNRKHVKNCNFAGIYGASEDKLRRMMGLSKEEATIFFEAYHGGLPYIRETMDAASRYAEEHGYTETILGRRAVFDRWEPKHTPRGAPRPVALKFNAAVKLYGPNIKRAYLHKALNYIIQGSAADLMKSAMVKCWKDGIFDVIGVPRLVVHDELVYSVREYTDEFEKAYSEMVHVMETAVKFRVPIRVESEWGPSWGKTFSLKD